MFEPTDIEQYNSDVKDWTADSKSPQPLQKALRDKTNIKFGLVSSISYSFPRHAVFLVKGVSRGHGKNNPRQIKDWFNKPIDQQVDKLSDIAADHQGNMVVNALRIK